MVADYGDGHGDGDGDGYGGVDGDGDGYGGCYGGVDDQPTDDPFLRVMDKTKVASEPVAKGESPAQVESRVGGTRI